MSDPDVAQSLPRWRRAPDWRPASCGVELQESAALKRYIVESIHGSGIRTVQESREVKVGPRATRILNEILDSGMWKANKSILRPDLSAASAVP